MPPAHAQNGPMQPPPSPHSGAPRGTLRTVVLSVIATLAVLAAGAVAVAALVVQGGLYDVASTTQHWKPVYHLLERAMQQSVRLRARGVDVPPLEGDALARQGAGCFRDQCVQCHGAPGVAQAPIGQSMQPLPGSLADASRRWQPRELYWLTRHGIRMSGMPAWEFHLDEQELWSVVAFLQRLPELDAAGYQALVDWRPEPGSSVQAPPACGAAMAAAPARAGGGDVARGQRAVYQHACNACHVIPGITGSDIFVGPPLSHYASRTRVAGVLPHTQDNLARWLRSPQHLKPGTTMPDLGLSPRDAQDIAAYLGTLR